MTPTADRPRTFQYGQTRNQRATGGATHEAYAQAYEDEDEGHADETVEDVRDSRSLKKLLKKRDSQNELVRARVMTTKFLKTRATQTKSRKILETDVPLRSCKGNPQSDISKI